MKDRLLNFLLAFAVFLIVFNYFLPQPEQKSTPSGIAVTVAEKSSTVPHIPVVSVTNATASGFVLDTCKDIEILKDYRKIEIDAPFAAFCKTVTVAPGAKADIDLSVIARIFENPGQYAFKMKSPEGESVADTTLEPRGTFRNFLTELFYRPILNLFIFLIENLPGHSLGLAIITITILIRIALLVPQHHILVSSRKMQAIQPKVKEIQKKHEGDQAKIGIELMELYKREGVNPLGSCLPLLIQMPLLIVLYWVIGGIGDPTNRFFLYSFLSNFDPSTVSTVFLGMELKSIGGIAGFVLAALVAFFQWLQIKLSLARNPVAESPKVFEKKEDGTLVSESPFDPQVMNVFMLWGMPAMIGISTYFFPAGV
ncbi:MAG: hypothetical protein QG650_513 [Patescibacteria group bacterium]|nr:hypothetical protein [Patescibacteria group bacterium]